jgi:hypothetical protein
MWYADIESFDKDVIAYYKRYYGGFGSFQEILKLKSKKLR